MKNFINSEKKVLSFLLIFSALIQSMVVLVLDIIPEGDFEAYLFMANSVLDNGELLDPNNNFAYYSPGWSLILVPIMAVFGSEPEVIQALNVLLGTLSVYLIFQCGKELLPDWRWAALPALVWSVYPHGIMYTELVAKENLMIPLILLQTLMLFRFSRTTNKKMYALGLGVLFGVQVHVGPSVLFVGATIVAILMLSEGIKRISFQLPSIFIISSFLIVSPWLLYTNDKLGEPILSSNGMINLYVGNNPMSDVNSWGIQHTPLAKEWATLKVEKGEYGAAQHLKELGLEYIFNDFGAALWRSTIKGLYFWMPPIHQGVEEPSTLESLVRIAWFLAYTPLLILSFAPLLNFKNLNRNHAILYSTIILYCMIHAATIIMFRYRLPIMPLLCLLSTYGLHYFFEHRFGKKGSKKDKVSI